MKKILSFCLLIICMNIMNVDAQHYSKGIGLRAGKFNTGITFKNFFATDNATALQLDLYYTNVASGGYTLKGFYIKQIPFNVPIIQLPLDFIFGGGINIGYFPFDPQGYYKREEKDANYYDSSVISVGAGATIQIEYQIKKIAPVTLGIEVVPFYEIINPGPEYVDVGVSIRYVFR